MKRLFVALTLLLMSFLSALEALAWLRELAGRAGLYRWSVDVLLAVAVVAVFARVSELHRRLLFPRRGLRLLAAGIAIYALAAAASTGLLVLASRQLASLLAGPWAGLPGLAAGVYPLPVFLLAQLLLIVGAFRALANLVPPGEFAEDF